MNTHRLLALANFLDDLPPEKFDFGNVVIHKSYSCGSAGCAIGWCPAVPELSHLAKWANDQRDGSLALINVNSIKDANTVRFITSDSTDYVDVGALLFDLTFDQSILLFTPCQEYPCNSSPRHIANRIRNFVHDYS